MGGSSSDSDSSDGGDGRLPAVRNLPIQQGITRVKDAILIPK